MICVWRIFGPLGPGGRVFKFNNALGIGTELQIHEQGGGFTFLVGGGRVQFLTQFAVFNLHF